MRQLLLLFGAFVALVVAAWFWLRISDAGAEPPGGNVR